MVRVFRVRLSEESSRRDELVVVLVVVIVAVGFKTKFSRDTFLAGPVLLFLLIICAAVADLFPKLAILGVSENRVSCDFLRLR